MKFELKVGDKVEIINNGIFRDGMVNIGDIATYKGSSGFSCPSWDDTQICTKDLWSECLKPYVVAKIKFPCCVPMSEIKDQDTFNKIFDLFIANGADEYETGYEEWKDYWYNYFGVDHDKNTVFYKHVESYSSNDEEDDVTIYSVAELLGTSTEDTSTLLPVGAEVKIAESSVYYTKQFKDSNPRDTKGTIKSNSRGEDHPYWVEWSNGKSNCYELNDLVLWGDSTPKTSQEAITDVLEDDVSVDIATSEEASEDLVLTLCDKLFSVDVEVLYKINIKSVEVKLTQEELDEVWLRLGILTSYNEDEDCEDHY